MAIHFHSILLTTSYVTHNVGHKCSGITIGDAEAPNLDVFRTNSRNIIGRNPSMVIPLLANQDLTPMLIPPIFSFSAHLQNITCARQLYIADKTQGKFYLSEN